ncbi:Vascular endothelial growth factor B [Orchesella cincta]|uniref:Vascular endothelial growth factor B n=1 Tax=Orchesella cincta TaxID=48709 RepID=A0A1D2MN94_ORCCI|nr:Vascular endothelial growth factor B [Orchesella cincta]
MKGSLLLTLFVLLSYFAVSNQQMAHGVTTPSNKASRAIDDNSRGNNQILSNNDEDSDNTDSAFDGSPGDDSEITFPSESPSLPKPNIKARAQYNPSRWRKIPLKTLVEIGNETNISNFLRRYLQNARVKKDPETNEEYLIDRDNNTLYNTRDEKVIVTPGRQLSSDPQPIFPSPGLTRSGAGIATRSRAPTIFNANDISGMKAKQDFAFAVCTPEVKTIPVPLEVEPHILIIPRCLRVERCGGCCLSDVMSCEPEKTEMADFHIKTLAYTGDDQKFDFVDDRIVNIERHLSCKCQCKTKKTDCNNVLHDYVENECSCSCKNRTDQEQCNRDPKKVWDENNCMCLCRETRSCSSGLYYNLNDCACQREPELRRKKKKRGAPVTLSSN